MKPAQLTQTISDSMHALRKSELKVAEYVLKNPLKVIRMRIVDLAEEAKVSEPTVVRFCRGVGCKGFQDFKLALEIQEKFFLVYHELNQYYRWMIWMRLHMIGARL